MNVKKTIAAIAAAALTASVMSVAVLADETDTGAGTGTGGGTTTTTPAEGSESGSTTTPTLGSGNPTVRPDTIGASTSTITTSTGDDGVINVGVTLTPAEGSDLGGLPQGGSPSGTKNYHLTIPMTGSLEGWTLTTTNGGQYDYDDGEHTDWNVDTENGNLMLWLPVSANECTVVLVKNGQYVKLKVSTLNGTTVVTPEPEPEPDPDPETPTETPEETTPPAADDDVTPPADDDVTPPAADDNNNAVVDDSDSDYVSAGVTGSSSGAAEVVVVSTPAQITATRNPVLTVNAAEAPVSSDMLDAFVKNDDAKTLTLSYSTALKIAIDKDDVSDTSADLSISVSTTGFLSAKEIKKLDATKVVQIDLEGEGKIEGVDKVTVKYRVGAKLAGKEVAVYEYVNGKLVKIGTGKVTANGFVNFKTDHYGQFVIAVE